MSTSTITLDPPEGIRPETWLRLAREGAGHWKIHERDEMGEVIGTAYRNADGSKHFERGGRRGLILEWPLDTYAGSSPADPVFVCEGASDTAAMLQLGLDAVGVPMAGQCGDMLAALLKGRHAVIVTDDDEAGERGAEKIAQQLVIACESVRIITPPEEGKDAREALQNGATADDFKTLASSAELFSVQPLSHSAGRNESNFIWTSIENFEPAEEPTWVWPGYIAESTITLLTGQWKSGKTTLLTHLLRDAYGGTGLVDSPIEKPILYISEESPTMWSARRDLHHLDPRILFLQRESFRRLDPKGWKELIDSTVAECKQTEAALVIIDTLAGLWPVTSENDAAEVSEIIAPLRDITETGAGLLLVHHPRKGDSSNFNAARGSGALPSFVDIIIEMKRYTTDDPKDPRRILNAVGRYCEIPDEVVIEYTDEGYIMLGERADVGRADDIDTLERIIKDIGDGAIAEQIRERWPHTPCIGKGRLGKLLSEGTEQGRWKRTGRGVKGDPKRFHPNLDYPDSILPTSQT